MLSTIDHVAIIMDGNGRWAERRSRPRFWGHVRGSRAVSEIVRTASDIGIKALTLYAFSTENWSRPIAEIKLLFKLLKKYIHREAQNIIDNNIRFRVIGNVSRLPVELRETIRCLEERTRSHKGLKLSIAFGYGGRKEIVDAVNFYISQNPGKPLCEEDIEKRLSTNDLGSVDLLIRTGGDSRISNFLLWQNAYAELRFTPTLWPNFGGKKFLEIITQFQTTNRRFGGLGHEIISIQSAKRKAYENRRHLFNAPEAIL